MFFFSLTQKIVELLEKYQLQNLSLSQSFWHEWARQLHHNKNDRRTLTTFVDTKHDKKNFRWWLLHFSQEARVIWTTKRKQHKKFPELSNLRGRSNSCAACREYKSFGKCFCCDAATCTRKRWNVTANYIFEDGCFNKFFIDNFFPAAFNYQNNAYIKKLFKVSFHFLLEFVANKNDSHFFKWWIASFSRYPKFKPFFMGEILFEK